MIRMLPSLFQMQMMNPLLSEDTWDEMTHCWTEGNLAEEKPHWRAETVCSWTSEFRPGGRDQVQGPQVGDLQRARREQQKQEKMAVMTERTGLKKSFRRSKLEPCSSFNGAQGFSNGLKRDPELQRRFDLEQITRGNGFKWSDPGRPEAGDLKLVSTGSTS